MKSEVCFVCRRGNDCPRKGRRACICIEKRIILQGGIGLGNLPLFIEKVTPKREKKFRCKFAGSFFLRL